MPNVVDEAIPININVSAIEDYLTYEYGFGDGATITTPPGKIVADWPDGGNVTATSNIITCTNLTKEKLAYLRKAGTYNDFIQYLGPISLHQAYLDSVEAYNDGTVIWAMAINETTKSLKRMQQDTDGISVFLRHWETETAGIRPLLYMFNHHSGGGQGGIDFVSMWINIDQQYWLTIERRGSDFYVHVFTDENRTQHLDDGHETPNPMHLTIQDPSYTPINPTYNYLLAFANLDYAADPIKPTSLMTSNLSI